MINFFKFVLTSSVDKEEMTKALLEYCTIHKPSAKSEAKDMKIRIKQEVLDSRRAATKDDKIKLCEIFAL